MGGFPQKNLILGSPLTWSGPDAAASQQAYYTLANAIQTIKSYGETSVYLAADATGYPPNTPIGWGSLIAGTWTNVTLQNFTLGTDGATLRCAIAGRYRFFYGARLSGLTSGTDYVIKLIFSSLPASFYPFTVIGYDTSATDQKSASAIPFDINMAVGDTVSLQVGNFSGTIGLGAGTTTGIVIQQLA